MRRTWKLLLLGFGCTGGIGLALQTIAPPALAQDAAAPAASAEGFTAPAATLNLEKATLRTQQDMVDFDARMLVPQLSRTPRYRSDVSAETLKSWKLQATGKAAPAGKIAPASSGPSAPATIIKASIAGATRAEGGNFYPPDTHGTVGSSYYMEVTNSHLDIYSKTAPYNRVNGCTAAPCPGVTLNAFFGYTTESLFDPRAVYDPNWKRFVITADSFPESDTVQYLFVAISKTSDPTGSYWIYKINVHGFIPSVQFYDFPMLGFDQDSLLFSANIFSDGSSSSHFVNSTLFSIAKAKLYNGGGYSVPVFKPACFTPQVPIVLDNNATTVIACAINANSSAPATTINLFKMTNSSRAGTTLSAAVPITVAAYSTPPFAMQKGTSAVLDAGDSRFSNNVYQLGTYLYGVHSVAIGSFPASRLYKFDWNANTLNTYNLFFASSTSYDINPSLAVNTGGDVFVTWTATDPSAASPQAQVRFGGFRKADAFSVGSGVQLYVSPVALTGNVDSGVIQRWGDYSAIAIDPSKTTTAWLINETIIDANNWGTRIGNVSF